MKNFWTILFLCAALSCAAVSARAGGPMLVDADNSGEPARWKNGVIRWKADRGPLTRAISNQKAIDQWVKPLFEKWKNAALPVKGGNPVVTVALDFIYEGTVDADITKDNYPDYTNPDFSRETVIIFDSDGSITQDFFERQGVSEMECGLPKNCIAGLGAPLADASTKVVNGGFMILNGRLIDGVNTRDNKEMAADQFKAVILHEMGHLLNLDHSQVNVEMAESCAARRSYNCPEGGAIPTMYPASLSQEQFLFHRDDVVTLSWLYPAQAFSDNFCTVTGEIKNAEGKGMQGVNVVAKNVNNPIDDARSWVSGVLYKEGTANGTYILAGLNPGEEYEVHYEELLHKYDGGGGFGPLGADSPVNLGAAVIPGPGGTATVKCGGGGQLISMPEFALTGTPQTSGAEAGLTSAEPAKEKKGWCQLNPSAALDWRGFAAGVWPCALLLLIFLKRCDRKSS